MIKLENAITRELTDDEISVVSGALPNRVDALGWTFFSDGDHGEWWGVDGAPIFIW
jgi:hypothetical protein